MPDVTNELIYEILKKVQADVSGLRADMTEVRNGLLQVREDIHRFEGNMLRIERLDAGTQMRLDRIEIRLGLTDG